MISPSQKSVPASSSSCSECLEPTILQANKGIIQARVRQQGSGLTRWGIGDHHAPGLQREDADLILRVNADEFVGAKLEKAGGRLAREVKRHQHPSLAKDIDLPTSKLGIAGAHGDQGLNRIIGDSADLRIHAASCKLETAVSVAGNEDAWDAKTYVVQEEQVWG